MQPSGSVVPNRDSDSASDIVSVIIALARSARARDQKSGGSPLVNRRRTNVGGAVDRRCKSLIPLPDQAFWVLGKGMQIAGSKSRPGARVGLFESSIGEGAIREHS